MRAHLLAVKTMIEGAWQHPVYLGEVPAASSYPYVFLWSSPGRVVAAEVDGVLDDLDETFSVTMVGATYEAALAVVPNVRGALHGRRPVVAGRVCQPLWLQPAGLAVQVDTTTKIPKTDRHPSYGVDRYRLRSEPA